MVVPINIDLKPLIERFRIDKEDIRPLVTSMLNAITQRIESQWKKEANSLGGTRAQYQEGIYVQKLDYNSAIVGLSGWLPNAIEQGISAFDMKIGFEKSNKKMITLKVDKNGNTESGWYLTIPFRQAVAGSLGESQAFSNIMPPSVTKVARNLEIGAYIKESMLPPRYKVERGLRPEVTGRDGKVYETYEHKRSIYEGIQKSGTAQHTGYVSFRRVSNNSDKNSWIHTGIQAHNFFEKAITNAQLSDVRDREVDKFLDSLGF